METSLNPPAPTIPSPPEWPWSSARPAMLSRLAWGSKPVPPCAPSTPQRQLALKPLWTSKHTLVERSTPHRGGAHGLARQDRPRVRKGGQAHDWHANVWPCTCHVPVCSAEAHIRQTCLMRPLRTVFCVVCVRYLSVWRAGGVRPHTVRICAGHTLHRDHCGCLLHRLECVVDLEKLAVRREDRDSTVIAAI